MDSFNLDTDAYSDQELEKLLGLPPKYTPQVISAAKKKIATQLSKDKSLGRERQQSILLFLDTVGMRLVNKIAEAHRDPGMGTWAESQVPVTQHGSNILISNPNVLAGRTASLTEGRIAVTGDAPPGFINPINVRTIMQAINIDSRFRPSYYTTTSTKFSMSLPEVQRKVISMRVASIELPMTYFAMSLGQGNCTFLIIAHSPHGGGGTPENNLWDAVYPGVTPPAGLRYAWLVRIPDGNYEQSWVGKSQAEHIETAVNNAIAIAAPGLVDITGIFYHAVGPLGLPATFTTDPPNNLNPMQDICYTVDRASGRSIFACPADHDPPQETRLNTFEGCDIRFNVSNNGSLSMDDNIQFRCGWVLGFRAAQYVMTQHDPPAHDFHFPAAVSEGICFPSGPRYGFLAVNDFQKNSGPSYLVAFAKSTLDDNIITRINLAAVMADEGAYKSSNDPGLSNQMNRTREYFGPVSIQKLEVTLYDEFGRVIDLNNMDWSFTLAFEKLYD